VYLDAHITSNEYFMPGTKWKKRVRVELISKPVKLNLRGPIPNPFLYGAILERAPKNADAYVKVTTLDQNNNYKPKTYQIAYFKLLKGSPNKSKGLGHIDLSMLLGMTEKEGEESEKRWQECLKETEEQMERLKPELDKIFG